MSYSTLSLNNMSESEKEMEEGSLLVEKAREDERRKIGLTWSVFAEEAKVVGYIGGPMVAVNLSMFLLQLISMMFVGHLGKLSLSSAALATSFCGVTGFSLLLGMASGLETLCGQAFGAGQYGKLGVQTYSAILSLTIFICLPISFLWVSMGKLLTYIGQDPLVSGEAGKYAVCLIPALFAFAILESLTRFLQSQSLMIAMFLSQFATLCVHVPLCWVLVYKSGLGNIRAALSIGVSYWLNVIFLVIYIKYSPSCEPTRASLSKEAFQGIGEFLRIAFPSAVMVCLEWWSSELLILLSGHLPNPQLETSVLSICLASSSLLYMIPDGIAAAVSTRVSNELGAGRPQAARLAVNAAMIITTAVMVTVSLTLYSCRNILGYAFTNEREVIDYVTEMIPLICLTVVMDNLQGVLSGVARGCGWQDIGAYVNLGAYYLAGVPLAILLGFHLHMAGKGLWIGIVTGSTIQSAMLSLITCRTNWEKQAINARERLLEEEAEESIKENGSNKTLKELELRKEGYKVIDHAVFEVDFILNRNN
ncbi:protein DETOXIFICATION 14-like [Papaver somniferum]|uniref:protein DETOXIFICATION 14-like n=1 Tax=Papaver somniferum TaxID=3469 RepID=UPI000E6F8D22|nr:protein DETOXIFICATION 14-like [Papaver somniferum]